MTRMSKQGKRRNQCPRKRKYPAPKTGSKKDNLPLGYKEHVNVMATSGVFIPKIG